MEFTDPLPICSTCGLIHAPDDEEACLGPPPVNDADERVALAEHDAYERSCS